MRAESLGIDFTAELERIQASRVRHRSAGDHLSEIISYIVNKLEPGRFGSSGPSPELAHAGFLWEDALSSVFAHQWGKSHGWHQIATESDGVHMTLDGYRVRDETVLEAKASKISAANPITSAKFWHWKIRTAGYCRALETTKAEIVVLHLNGSYELGGGRFGAPVAKGWAVEFTRRELEEMWESVLRARDRMKKDREWQERKRALESGGSTTRTHGGSTGRTHPRR